jgi:tape measure domain-containing protein
MAGDLNFKVNFDTAQAGAELQSLLEKFIAGSESAGNRLNRALGGTTERKVVIRTEVDETGVKKLTSQVLTLRSEADKLRNAFASATRVDRDSITSLRGQIRQATQARDAVQQFGQAIDLTNRKQVLSAKQTEEYTALDARVKSLQQSLKNLQDADKGLSGRLAASFGDLFEKGRKFQDLVSIFQSFGIVIGAFTAPIKAATNALADLDQFRLSFQAIGQSSDAASIALSDASRIALGLGVNIKTVRDGFQQLSPVVLNTGGTLNDVSAITESLASRFAAFGLGAEKSRRVLNGVIQAFGKGKLQAEELTQQISEADPAFKTDFANALFKSVDALKAAGGESAQLASELSALAKSGQRPVTALEGLVKQGKITAAVLTQILPKLSKADILFGKLGPTASSGVEAFKRGVQGLDEVPVTLRQVQANIENINQLNLEKFAKTAEPLVLVFVELQAGLADFISRLGEIGTIKDLVSILSAIGTGVANVTKFILTGLEGIIRLLGVLTPLIKLLTQIPGLVELIGAALLIKFIKPVSESVASAKTLIQAFRDIGKAKDALDGTGGNTLFDPKSSQVAQKSLSQLRKELETPVGSGITESVKGTEKAVETLSKKQINQLNKIQERIVEAREDYRDLRVELERSIQGKQTKIELIDSGEATKTQARLKEVRDRIDEIGNIFNTVSWQDLEEAANVDQTKVINQTRQLASANAEVNTQLANRAGLETGKSDIGGLTNQLSDQKKELDKAIQEAALLEAQISNVEGGLGKAAKTAALLPETIATFPLDIQNAVKNLKDLDDAYFGINRKLERVTQYSVGGFVDKSTLEELARLSKIDPSTGLRLYQEVQKNIINEKNRFKSAIELNLVSPALLENADQIDKIFAKFESDAKFVQTAIDGIDVNNVGIDDLGKQGSASLVSLKDALSGVKERITDLRSNISRLATEIAVVKSEDVQTVSPQSAAAANAAVSANKQVNNELTRRVELEQKIAALTARNEQLTARKKKVTPLQYTGTTKNPETGKKEYILAEQAVLDQVDRISKKIEDEKKKIRNEIRRYNRELAKLGEPPSAEDIARTNAITQAKGKTLFQLQTELDDLQRQLAKLEPIDAIIRTNFDLDIQESEASLLEQRKKIEKLVRRQLKLQTTADVTTTFNAARSPEATVTVEDIDAFKKFREEAVRSYIDAKLGSEQYVKQAKTEIETLDRRAAALEKARRNASSLPVAVSGGAGANDELRAIQQQADYLRTSLAQLDASWARSYQGVLDYEDVLSALDQGAKITDQQLHKLASANEIIGGAASRAADEVSALTQRQAELTERSRQLGKDLAGLSLSDKVEADKLNGELTLVKGELVDVGRQLDITSNSANLLQQEAALIGTALEQASKPRAGLQGIKDIFTGLTESSNKFGKAFGNTGLVIANGVSKINGAITTVVASIREFSAQLLPFAAISIAIAAYSKATEASRTIQEENKQTTDRLKSTIKDLSTAYAELGGTVQKVDIKSLTPQINGLDVVLISLGGILKKTINLFKQWFDVIKGSTIDPLTGQIKKTYSTFEQFASSLGLIASAALVGGRVFGPWGAGIAGVAAAAAVLTIALNTTGAKIDQLKEKGTALREGYVQEIQLLKQLAGQVRLFGDEYLKAKAAAEAANKKGGTGAAESAGKDVQYYSKTLSAYGTLIERTKALRNEQTAALGTTRATAQEAFRLTNEIRLLETKRDSTDARKREKNGEQGYRTSIQNQINAKKDQLKVIEEANAQAAASERLLKAELTQLEAELERLRVKYGLLTKEQLANANNTSNLKDKLKEAKAALDLLDFTSQRKKFDEIATSVGTIQAQLDKLENAAKERELAGYVAEVKRQLASGEIPTSLSTIQNLVKSLEERSVMLDINSPQLPKVLQDLLKAEEYAGRLDGKKAQITLELIERGVQNGSLKDTLALREKQLEELGKVKQSTPIGSKEYEAILAKEKQLTQAKENDEKTVDELRSQLAQKQIDRIDNIIEKQKNASEKRIQQIENESKAIEKQYDAQIKALEGQRGPAEQELAKLQRADLEAKAKQPGRSGLEARAELERLAREEKVAQLKEEKEKKVQELADQRAAIEETITQNEYQLLDTRIAAEKEIARIRGTQIDQEISGLQQSIRNRASGQTGTTGTTTAVPGGTQQSVDQAKAAGEQAGKAYSTGYQMSIKAAGPPENDPNAKVKYNFQDPAVIAASKERNTLQEQYNALLASTKALEQQQARTTPGQQDSSVTDQILSNYQQLAALQAQMASAEQNYSNSLQATKQVTGQIVITNQTLAQQFGQLSNTKPATPVDLSKLSEAYQKVTQLNAEYKKQQGIVNALKTQAASSDPAVREAAIQKLTTENAKLQELQKNLNGAKTAYGSLESTATGQGLSNSITPDNLEQVKNEIKNWASGLDTVDQSGQSISSTLQSTSDVILQIAAASKLTEDSFKNAAGSVGSEMLPAIQQIEPELNNIQQQLDDIFNKTYEVAVVLKTEKQGLWTGGPATGGTVYKVNELGQEGFMNKFGRVTPIRKARNSSWRAPGDGFVIPADIYSQMSQTSPAAPSVGISPATPKAPSTGNDSLRSLAKFTAMLAAKAMQPSGDNGTYELSKVQAHQAQEIGKLSRAVQELNEKDWNVNVKVRNDNSLAYLKALNHRL